ncbi:MAG: O-methyltransferase [Bacilli bacterium]|nr:O-methyltransferase [Bacilli bacterium]
MINDIKQYAKLNNVPIMEDDGINYLINFIKTNNIKSILEIGSAIGYSAIMMAMIDNNIKITTIEKDKNRCLEAVTNINNCQLTNQIKVIYGNALDDIEINNTFDLIFIDAAKSKSQTFFEKYQSYLNPKGIIITDNINLHGLVKDSSLTKNKNTLKLINKIKSYIDFLKTNNHFITEFIDIGDGLSISRKK